MYLGFELERYEPFEMISNAAIEDYRKQARNATVNDLADYIIGQIDKKDVIDAKKLAKKIFPQQQAHVFLSHSHRDEREAIEFALSLEKRGVEVFVDSCVWGYVGDLLLKINAHYSDKEEVGGVTNFSYDKCNEVAASLFLMLNEELHRMIDATECFIFFNTQNSVSIKGHEGFAEGDRTLSPWIYSELAFSAKTRYQLEPRERLPRGIVGAMESHKVQRAMASASFAFEIINLHLPKLSGNDMKSLADKTPHSGFFWLDALYYEHDLESEFTDRCHAAVLKS
ncbi:toll/interleukin-1 receptor domain-containing protein [Pseudomonas atacamensis]|uniref:toll/interleukin-1 receptor domain-containing protein n=1 Tax=Pseudomonas atacamensis TaxID=2565368 RepID=UPI001FAC5FE6|nr:toll/interleukin-1 receptor domain-containing protein [Pseudomonas atacamensis]MCI9876951.1 toll/interleukin-1 receptor domain-containing protein [Pseudomonas atacamensis]